MALKSLKQLAEELRQQEAICNGNHDLEDKPSAFSCAGRFGGHTFSLYKCKRCGDFIADEEEYKLAHSYYDKGGRPFEDDKKIPQSCYEEFGPDLDGCSRQENEGCHGCRCLE